MSTENIEAIRDALYGDLMSAISLKCGKLEEDFTLLGAPTYAPLPEMGYFSGKKFTWLKIAGTALNDSTWIAHGYGIGESEYYFLNLDVDEVGVAPIHYSLVSEIGSAPAV